MKFKASEVVSVATGRLCCDIGRVYEILNYLTSDNLFTHQLPRASRVCEPFLKQQLPWLNDLNPEECNTENWQGWLRSVVEAHGDEHELTPLPEGAWTYISPIVEAESMMGKKEGVIVVSV